MTAQPPPAADDGLDDLVTKLIAEMLATRLGDLLDPKPLVDIATAAAHRGGVAWFITHIVRPVRTQLVDELRKASTERLTDLVPSTVIGAFAATAKRPLVLPKAVVETVATSEFLGREIREILRDALDAYLARGASGGSLRDALGRGVRALGAARGLLGGIGDEVRKQLRARLSDFVDESFDLIQERAARRLVNPEVQREMSREAMAIFVALLESTLAEAAESVPDDLLDTLEVIGPAVVDHVMQRPQWQERARAALSTVQTTMKEETVGSLLTHLQVREEVEALLRMHLRTVVQRVTRS